MQASCQCGVIRFDAPASEPIKVYICHCTECRHQSSSAFGISAMFPRGAFERAVRPVINMMVEDGNVKIYERSTLTGGTKQCLFCSSCGCQLLHMGKDEEEKEGGTVSIKGGCLDGLTKEMLKDAKHIWTKSAVAEVPVGAKQFPEEPDD